MREFILDGRFLAQPRMGVQRFSSEVLRCFAQKKDVHVVVAMPVDAGVLPVESENIEYVTVGRRIGTKWEQKDLVKFCKDRKLPLLCTANAAPIFYHAYTVLHDVLWIDMKKFAPKRSWFFKAKLMLRSVGRKQDQIFTVSGFSRDRISALLPKLKRTPIVVGSGYEHVLKWSEEPVENLPGEFFLSVGSVSPHKNFGYVLHLAKHNPSRNFVIAGKLHTDFMGFIRENNIKNCVFLDYVSDGQLKWLYRRCQGFILPSLYEGFGLPPLEAAACGCKRLFLSDIPVFREIYGSSATYFDPRDTEHTVSLDTPEMDERAKGRLLYQYTWEHAADEILSAMFKGVRA